MKNKELWNSLGYSEDVMQEIKKVLLNSDAEQKEAVSREELYNRMVDEAVLLIQSRWMTDAECRADHYRMAETFEVVAYNVFFTTEDMILYSECGIYAINPQTKKCCFYDFYTFSSEEEKQKYIADVMARLPRDTKYEVKKVCHPCGGTTENYTFKVKVNKD